MRIAKVTPISVAYPEPNDSGATRHLTFCRIESTDGTVGWGESVTMWPEACRATEKIIEGMGELIVGRDVADNRAIWRQLRDHIWWYGYRGGVSYFALSAIDLALWDLKGKDLGQSVLKMLGGAVRDSLPAIASTHAFLTMEEEVEKHGRWVQEDGYRGVKIGMGKAGVTRLGYEAKRDIEFVRQLREAVGPDAWIMLDRGVKLTWDLEHAIRLIRKFEEYGLRWMEEPFEPYEFINYKKLRGAVNTMLAWGEREWDERGYREVIGTGTADVVGCDPGRVGGITGALQIMRLVEEAGVWFNAHAWSGAVVTSASLALSLSTDRCLLFEFKPIENPMQHELVTNPFVHDRGTVGIPPERPGLGIDVQESVIQKYKL